MIQDYFDWDVQIFLYFNNLGNEKWDWFWLLVTDKKTWIPLYVIFLILLYVKPIDTVFKNIHVLHFSIENILKIILFFSAFSILIYTGIYHFKLIKTVKKVKYFIKYL